MSNNDPIEKLRILCSRAFPDNKELASIKLASTLKEGWYQLAHALGSNKTGFTSIISNTEGTAVAISLNPSTDALNILPETFVRANQVLPLLISDNCLSVVIANPCDDELIKSLKFASKLPIKLFIASPDDIEEAIQLGYAEKKGLANNKLGNLKLDVNTGATVNDSTTAQIARELLKEAVNLRASDLHIQPYPGGATVRARVDGLLQRLTLLPENVYLQLARYFKIQSGMDISNDRTPQDGRLSLNFHEHSLDLRLSSLPVRGGERLVIRFLDQNRQFHLTGSGFSLSELQAFKRLISNSSGLVLISGPTGSGKTSTLYALIAELNAIYRNIITVENPVEYVLTGISQVDVNPKAGLTFGSALRSALRQDPEVILVGEIRDQETAQIAFQAALTGHLVLSTIHTNDSFSAIPRLLDLGVQETILSEALLGVVSQRLCRALCTKCRVPVKEPLRNEEKAFKSVTKLTASYRPVGCDACGYTGFYDRFPITEVLELSNDLRQVISSGNIGSYKPEPPKLNSLDTLSSSVTHHIVSGSTTINEAVRVIGRRYWLDLGLEYKTDVPEINLAQDELGQSNLQGILILGQAGKENDDLILSLKQAWFQTYTADSSALASKLLKTHEEIVHVIVNFDNELSNDEIIAYIQQIRVDLYWSRLPALMLLPSDSEGNREGLEAAIIADGAINPCISKPVSSAKLISLIKQSIYKQEINE